MTHPFRRSPRLPITQHPTKAEMDLFSPVGIWAAAAHMARDPISPAGLLLAARKQRLPELKAQRGMRVPTATFCLLITLQQVRVLSVTAA